MRADNSHHVVAAARRRSQATRRRALAAVRRMSNTGLPITIEAVAREAGVSRSWLYSQPDLRAEIERLRQRAQPAAGRAVPDRQRGSDTSLLRRLELGAQRIRELEADNKRLRHALAEALGERRARPTPDRRDTPSPRISPATRPHPTTASPTPSETQTSTSHP
jgi:hypothetical protein